MNPGLYSNMTIEDYLAVDALSASQIVRILRSPAHYKYAEEKDKDCFRVGEANHCIILEPAEFNNRFAMMPEGLKRDGSFMPKIKDEDLKEQGRLVLASGKTILSASEYKTIKGMEEALWQCPEVHELLDSGESEVSGFWYDPSYPEILCKIRLDWLNKQSSIVIDLKSCTDARLEKFTSDAYRLGYFIKAAHYLSGITQITKQEHKDFRFIAQEKESPYAIQVYWANMEYIQEGLTQCHRALATYHACLEKDEWPAYPSGIQELGLPKGKMKREPGFIIE